MTVLRKHSAVAGISLIALCGVVIFYEQIFSGTDLGYSRGFMNDLFLLTWPSLDYTAQRLLEGEIPLWNPYWYGGMPNLAVPNSMVLYPTTFLFGLLPFHTAYKVVALFHAFLGGIFGYMLGMRISPYRSVAIICGFQFFVLHVVHAIVGITGVMLLGHLWTTQTAAWAPLGFLALLHLLEKWSHGWGITFAGALVMSAIAGDPQIFSYILLWYGGYSAVFLIWDFVSREADLRGIVLRGAGIIGCLCLTLLICSIIVLPMREFLIESIRKNGFTHEGVRGTFDHDYIRFYPNILLSHQPLMFVTGKVVLALAFVAVVSAKRKMTFALIATGTACAIYSLMPKWLFEGVVQHLPIYGKESVPLRAAISVGFIFIVLTGIGVHTLIDRGRDGEKGRYYWTGFACVLTVLCVIPFFFESERDPVNLIVAIISVAGAFVIWRRPRFASMGAPILVVLVLVSGVFVAREIAQTGHVNRIESPDDYADFIGANSSLDRIALFKDRESLKPRKDPAKVQGLALRHRSRSIGGHHALISYRYARFLSEVSGFEFVGYDADGRLKLDKSLSIGGDWLTLSSTKALDLLNVKYLATFAPPLLALENNPRFKRFEQGGLTVYENDGVMPPVYVLHDILVFDTDEGALNRIREPSFPYRSTGTITGDFDTEGLAPPTRAEIVTVAGFQPERIDVDVELSSPGVIVFSEVYYPGWKVSVDDGPFVDMLCIDTVFRGVKLDSGVHSIRTRYRPSSVYFGALLSIVGLLVYGGWISMVVLRARENVRSPDALESGPSGMG